jgi:hypothetical protein
MLRSASFSSLALLAFAAGVLAVGCGSSDQPTGPVGGPVTGALDMHCSPNGVLTPTHVGMCLKDGTNTSDDAAAPADDGSAPSDDGGADGSAPSGSEYGPILFNDSGYDDDCKYHVSFQTTPIRKNANVTFTVNVQGLDPAGPALGAAVYAEVFLTDTDPTRSSPKTTEVGNGVYSISPVVFQDSGRWTVRFHFYEQCSDAPEDSPHGHAAFYIDVP